MQPTGKKAAMRRGLWVFVVLVVLTWVEYLLVLMMDSGNLPYMIVMNVVDAALILYYFMHVAHLWHRED